MQLPIDEKIISQHIGRAIHSPILVDTIEHFEGIDKKAFLDFYAPLFQDLAWDYYDVKRQQYELLLAFFKEEKARITEFFVPYYTSKKDQSVFRAWLNRLPADQIRAFENIQPWRRRSIARFGVYHSKTGIQIERKTVPQFAQQLDTTDIRSLPRVFEESPSHHVENQHFYTLLQGIYQVVKRVRPDMNVLDITAHFMSVRAMPTRPGDNSPEGAHEDGADYIISALVINRHNLRGGESQVIEQLASGEKVIVFRHILQPGEFVFQADSKDELIYGTDLWHHVTPFYLDDPTQKEGWRDIIGFDINVVV